MAERPLHEVVWAKAPIIVTSKAGDRFSFIEFGPELAAVLKAYEELTDQLAWLEREPEATLMRNCDTAAADLRRALEGK